MWKRKVVCPGVPLFDAQASLLSVTEHSSLPSELLARILPYNLHLTGRLDRTAGLQYLQQLLSDTSRPICFLLLSAITQVGDQVDGEHNGNSDGGMEAIGGMLEEAGKYGVGVGDPQYIKDIYFLTPSDSQILLPALELPNADTITSSLVLVIVPQRNLM